MVFPCMYTIILIIFTSFTSCPSTHVDPSLFPMSYPFICMVFFDSMRLIAYNSMGNLLMPIYMILEYRRQYLSPQLGFRHCLSQYFKEHKSEGILGSEYFEKQHQDMCHSLMFLGLICLQRK